MWSNEWWKKDKWRSQIKLPDNKFEYLFDILKKYFDESWIDRLGVNKATHPIVGNLSYGEGIPQLSHLLRIASYIDDLKEVHGFINVLKDYKTLQHSKSAELELFMAHVLFKTGYDVSFIIPKPKKGRTPDILVKSDTREFVVECKFLNDVAGENWYYRYRAQFAMNILKEVPSEKALIYIPDNEYLNIWDYGYPDNLVSSEIAAYIDSLDIVNQIKKLKYGFYSYASVDVHRKGTILWLDETETIRGAIHLPDLNHRFLNKRLIYNGVNKANLQIEAFDKPGIAAVFQSKPVHEIDLKKTLCYLFEVNKEKYSKLMGVIVFPAQNILGYIEPILVENPYCKFQLDDFNIKRSLYPLLKFKE